ncbi:MAG: class I SAM-dependent methyltransferase [Verrucomicrobiales bacterium]|nr:class I SAM-dependent methyltransferase [Verrucomicrobiales bacterium]
MANRYYQDGEKRAEGVQDLFAAVAPRYDLINDLQSFGMHRLWKRRLVRLAEVKLGEAALDLCCGTGDIAFALARAGAKVSGVDFSAAMLDVARRRSVAAGSGTVTFEQGDALSLRFAAESFDLVTIGYGLRNLRSIDAGLGEIARVTRPGGRLMVLDFAFPSNRVWKALYTLHLKTMVPALGRLFCGDADTHSYILESLRRYPGPAEIGRRLESAGWKDVRWWNVLGGVMTLHRGVRAGGRSV